MKNNILAIVLAGVVLFFWGFASWTLLPWHNTVAQQFHDQSAVAQVLKENATAPGIYYLPFAQEDHKEGEAAAFMSLIPNGFDMNMGKKMGVSLLGHFLSIALVILLLRQTSGLRYVGRVGFIAVVGLCVGVISHLPYWNWFEFSGAYTMVIIFDTLIAWTLAGCVIAKFVEGRSG